MKFIEQEIKGVFLIEPERFVDKRGIFRRHFCQKELAEFGFDFNVAQSNISENPHLYTLRGFHYQMPPFGEDKILTCFTGAIYDIVVDIRKDSETYLKWIKVEISAENKQSLLVPSGCANSYLTTSEDTLVHYYMSEFYQPNSYTGFRYNDPAFDFQWPVEPICISDRDLEYHDFQA